MAQAVTMPLSPRYSPGAYDFYAMYMYIHTLHVRVHVPVLLVVLVANCAVEESVVDEMCSWWPPWNTSSIPLFLPFQLLSHLKSDPAYHIIRFLHPMSWREP